MADLHEWGRYIPIVAVLLLIVILPGFLMLMLLRVRVLLSVAVSPALSALFVGVATILLGRVGVAWDGTAYIVLCCVTGLFGLIIRRSILPVRPRVLGRGAYVQLTCRTSLINAGAITVYSAAIFVPLILYLKPDVPNPGVDPMYHYNALNAIAHTGNASMFSAMDFNYGLRVTHVTYPSVWHAFVVLAVPFGGIVPTANIMAYVVTPILYAVGLFALVRQLFPDLVQLASTALIAAIGFPAFPIYLTVAKAFWPNSLALAMLPGVLALLMAVRYGVRWGRARARRSYALLIALLVLASIAGLSLTHPSLFFSVAWVLSPFAIGGLISAVKPFQRRLSRKRQAYLWSIFSVCAVVGVTAIAAPQRVRGYLARPSTASWSDVGPKLVSAIVNWPLGSSLSVILPFVVQFIPMFCVGLIIVLRNRKTRWIASAWLLQLVLVFGSYFPILGISNLAGLWYSDSYRLFAVQNIFVSIIIAVAAAGLLGIAGNRELKFSERFALPRPVSWLLMLVTIGFLVHQGNWAFDLARYYARDAGMAGAASRPIGNSQELSMIEGLGAKIPRGSIIIGDPASGVAYAPLYSDVQSVFTQVNIRDLDVDGIYLYQNFDDIRSDPAVCKILREYGIGYYYEDQSMLYNDTDRAAVAPGFYGVDTSNGFTLVAEGGGASVWRIDACGRIVPPSDWWDRRWRQRPLVDVVPGTPADGERPGQKRER